MSYTEIVAFYKDGTVTIYDEVRNAWRGAMFVWTELEKKYLPSLPLPDWWHFTHRETDDNYYSRTCAYALDEEKRKKAWKEIWDLFYSPKITREEKIILGTTFDHTIVKRENFPELIETFKNYYPNKSSFPEQAAIIEEMYKDEEIIAVAWNVTSVCQNQWTSYIYEENEDEDEDEDGEYRSYNLETDDEHWFLFDADELNKN